MRPVVIERASGLSFVVSQAEGPSEEESGVRWLGPRRGLLLSRPGPITMLGVNWPLGLVSLQDQPDGSALVIGYSVALPGLTVVPSVVGATRLLELPASWGLTWSPWHEVVAIRSPRSNR